MATSTQFSIKDFLTLTDITKPGGCIWRSIHLNFSLIVREGWKFPAWVVLEPLAWVPTSDVIKDDKKCPKRPKNKTNGRVIGVSAAAVVGSTRWRPALGCFALCQGLGGRRYENHSTLFSLVLRGKEKTF